MRYAIISDLHANLQATEAVLQDLAAQRVDAILCLGDAVGYGPQPAEVLSLVHAHTQVMLMGNHDAAAAGLIDVSDFSSGARSSLASTKQKLNAQAVQYLASLPYDFATPGFACTHADFADPQGFAYVETEEDAQRSFAVRREPLLFVGHTHEAVVFLQRPDGTCERLPPEDFTLQRGHRYLVNPGSVGMPRTEDFRATYCVFDAIENRVTFHRTSYSVQTFRRLVEHDAGDSEQLSFVLGLLDSHALPVLQSKVDFSAARPPPANRPGARKVVLPAAATVAGRKPPAPLPPSKPARKGVSVGLVVAIVVTVLMIAGVAVYLNGRAAKRATKRPANLWIPPADNGATPAAATVAAAPMAPAGEAMVEGTTDDTPHTYTKYGLAAWVLLDGSAAKVNFKLVSQPYGASARKDVATEHQAILAIPAVSPVWQKADWIVTPDKDGTVTLVFTGRPNKDNYHLWMLYDDVSATGGTIRNGGFEEAGTAWTGDKDLLVRDSKLAHSGESALKSGSQKFWKQPVAVKAGENLHLTFWYRTAQ